MSSLGDRDYAGCFTQSGDLLQIQAEVEEECEDVTQLSGAGLQQSGADPMRTSCFAQFHPVQFPFHLKRLDC